MIARDTGGGGSFLGAGLYYLHDRGAETDERVAFTHTENLLTDDAEKSLRVMAWTAQHQAELKAAAGVKATGRKLEKPVQTFAFSWAKGETPDHAHMVETAKSAMKALGLEAHEALYVGHSDTEHRHVHVIVNRVHPETGKAAPLSKSRLALSKWAEAYEREHGVHCQQRIENNRRREKGDRVIDLDSRRRNAEQFSDWREKRRGEAADDREKRRFQEWADRKTAAFDQDRQARAQRLERAQAAHRELAEARIAAAYDTRTERARLEALDASLAARGIKGLWRRLSGKSARDAAAREAIRKTIAGAHERRHEALQGLRVKLNAQRGRFLEEEHRRARGLALRIDSARTRRETEGWKSYKTARAPETANHTAGRPSGALQRAAQRTQERGQRSGPQIER